LSLGDLASHGAAALLEGVASLVEQQRSSALALAKDQGAHPQAK
jgi:hypothetical protein